MKNSALDQSMAHGFFHTMVVMGSALALGCGGESRSTAQGASGGTAGMNTDGAGGGAGNGGTGGGAIAGGAGTGALGGGAGLGGSGGSGGVIMVGTGGSAGMAPAPDCPTPQWACQNGGCNSYDLTDTASECTCDASRPKTPADCDSDQTMVCLDGARYNASGNVVLEQVPYECKCIERQTDCTAACLVADAAWNRGGYTSSCMNDDPTAALDPGEPVLCGCAPIVLK
jgi:hypothetical protein